MVNASLNKTDDLVQASIDMIASGIAILDGNGLITVINKTWRDFGPASGCVGGSAQVGDSYADACLDGPMSTSSEGRRIVEDIRSVLSGEVESAVVEYETQRESETRWYQSRVERISGYHPPRILITHEDVTAIHELRSASAAEVATSLDVAVLGVDVAGIIRMANEAAGALFGMAADLLPGRAMSGLITSFDSPVGSDGGHWLRAGDDSTGLHEAPLVVRVLRNDGGEFTGEARRLALPEIDPSLNGVVIRDLTDRRRLATMLEFNAFHDTLTGLPNRTLLFDLLRTDLGQSAAQHKMLAAFYIEIEQAEDAGVNTDSKRHEWIVKVEATRLRQTVRTGDTIARLGGGQFVVIVPNLQEVGDACFAAQRLLETLSRPVPIGDEMVEISAGIGAAIFPWDSPEADILLDRAREALHIARASSVGAAVGGSDVFLDLFETLRADVPE